MTKILDRTAAHHDHPIDTRLKISALWTAMLFIFAYVDLFSLYRPDVRADIEAGKAFVFDRVEVGQACCFLGPNGLSPSRNVADGARQPQTRRLVCARGGGPTPLGPAHQKMRTR